MIEQTTGKTLGKAIGEVVHNRRKRLGLSQEELSARAELHRTYVSDIERGGRNASLITLARLSSALGVSLWQLVEEAEKVKNSSERPQGGEPEQPAERLDTASVNNAQPVGAPEVVHW
jgi:transcriptional regulator with XRE-family HTH domain